MHEVWNNHIEYIYFIRVGLQGGPGNHPFIYYKLSSLLFSFLLFSSFLQLVSSYVPLVLKIDSITYVFKNTGDTTLKIMKISSSLYILYIYQADLAYKNEICLHSDIYLRNSFTNQ